jgi:hypothetical protein
VPGRNRAFDLSYQLLQYSNIFLAVVDVNCGTEIYIFASAFFTLRDLVFFPAESEYQMRLKFSCAPAGCTARGHPEIAAFMTPMFVYDTI